MTETEGTRPSDELPPEALLREGGASDGARRVWQSSELLAGECEAMIVHRGQVYRLRCTKHGKLILYK